MIKTFTALLLLWSTAGLAGIDDHFSKGVLGLEWGASLQDVQAAFPGGTSWPTLSENGNGEVVYAVAGDFRLLDVRVPVPLMHFIFTADNQLQRAYFHFRYVDRDLALYAIAEVLGQDYSIRDERNSRQYGWKAGRTSLARFDIGAGPQFPWAYFAVRSIKGK